MSSDNPPDSRKRSPACASGSRGVGTDARLVLVIIFALSSSLAWAQTPGVWEELANTRFDQSPAVCGKPGAAAAPLCVPVHLNAGNDIQAAIFAAWSGGAFDAKRRELVIAATGGHFDWAGNQVVAFRLPTATVPGGWLSRRGPSRVFPISPAPDVCPYPADGMPCSVHSYDAVAYLPDPDVVWYGGGLKWYSGNPTWQTWWFNSADNSWTRKADRTPTGVGMASVWDPVSKRLLYRDQAALRAYDPATDTTVRLINLGNFVDSFAEEMSTAALDVKGRKFYRIRRKQSTTTPGMGLKMIDLAAPTLGERTLLATGDLAVEMEQGGGIFFHVGRLIAYGKTADGLNGALYSLDPTGCGLANQPLCVWTRWAPPSEPLPPPGTSRGMWKKVFLDTDGQTIYVIPDANKNVWRMTSPWATPPPAISPSSSR
jgi:hypothetical protein